MSQPNIFVRDTAAASATRHGSIVLLATQILGRVLVHNGVGGISPELLGLGAELAVDLVSGVLSAGAATIGALLHRRRSA